MTSRVIARPLMADPAVQTAAVPQRLAVRRLTLTRFRNYAAESLDIDGPAVVLTGPNGAGKTNLLEAVSFLTPGRGLRRARLSEVDRLTPGDMADAGSSAWAVAARVDGKLGAVTIGTGRDPDSDGERRLVRVDGAPARSQSALGDHVTVSWLTPAMDRLFLDGASGRRRFLDRMVFAFDPEHSTRVNHYEHAWRERNRLIKDGVRDPAWFAALEETLAATGIAVAAARSSLVARLNQVCAETEPPFPAAELTLDGTVDRWLDEAPALEIEDRLRATLAAGRRPGSPEAEGPHRSDLLVRHVPKDMPAERCSTGEQKALLVGIVLAHARLQAIDEGASPILLLDEVAAHLDDRRRTALFEAVLALGGQAWLTGTDRGVFAPIADRAQIVEVTDGRLAPAGTIGLRGEKSNG
ncbi:DNA replication/repair protein RecF [Thalassobaculum sp.]|uniref:DNA replication/repair protein RecF n=1 Tax=Thalassobaculum sp. TaxID=2022740 RepID=UPI0032EAF15A